MSCLDFNKTAPTSQGQGRIRWQAFACDMSFEAARYLTPCSNTIMSRLLATVKLFFQLQQRTRLGLTSGVRLCWPRLHFPELTLNFEQPCLHETWQGPLPLPRATSAKLKSEHLRGREQSRPQPDLRLPFAK